MREDGDGGQRYVIRPADPVQEEHPHRVTKRDAVQMPSNHNNEILAVKRENLLREPFVSILVSSKPIKANQAHAEQGEERVGEYRQHLPIGEIEYDGVVRTIDQGVGDGEQHRGEEHETPNQVDVCPRVVPEASVARLVLNAFRERMMPPAAVISVSVRGFQVFEECLVVELVPYCGGLISITLD